MSGASLADHASMELEPESEPEMWPRNNHAIVSDTMSEAESEPISLSSGTTSSYTDLEMQSFSPLQSHNETAPRPLPLVQRTVHTQEFVVATDIAHAIALQDETVPRPLPLVQQQHAWEPMVATDIAHATSLFKEFGWCVLPDPVLSNSQCKSLHHFVSAHLDSFKTQGNGQFHAALQPLS